MQVKNLGRKTIEQVRARIAEIRLEKADVYVPKTIIESGPEIDWAKRHVNLIRAIMAGEVIIRVR